MSVIALKVGTVDISLTQGFERQGFAVTEITGLSDYGEHKMGVPGSVEVVITGNILPGADPVSIRSYLYGSMNPYKPFILQVFHRGAEYPIQTMAMFKSFKPDINSIPSSIVVTLLRYGGWYIEPIIKQLTPNLINDSITGVFEFVSPITLEIQLLNYFSMSNLENAKITVEVGGVSSIGLELRKLLSIIEPFSSGLNEGTVIRVDSSLEYHSSLLIAGRSYDLPVLGRVVSGMIPACINPSVRLITTLDQGCSIGVILQTRQTRLTI